MFMSDCQRLVKLQLGYGPSRELDHECSVTIPRIEQINATPVFPARRVEGFARGVDNKFATDATCAMLGAQRLQGTKNSKQREEGVAGA